MTNRNGLIPVGCVGAAALLLSTGLVGCGEDEVQVQAPPPRQLPPPPPPPKTTSVDDLRTQLNVDQRVQMLDKWAPSSDADRKAVLTFFDAFARQNPVRVREMLAEFDKTALDDLIQTGQWEEATNGIEEIEIVTGPSPVGKLAVLAIFTIDSQLQPTLWHVETGIDGATFEAQPTPPNILNRVSGIGQDLINAWHQVIQEEMARAQEPDFQIELPQEVLEHKTRGGRGRPSQPAPGSPPEGPPGTPPEIPG